MYNYNSGSSSRLRLSPRPRGSSLRVSLLPASAARTRLALSSSSYPRLDRASSTRARPGLSKALMRFLSRRFRVRVNHLELYIIYECVCVRVSAFKISAMCSGGKARWASFVINSIFQFYTDVRMMSFVMWVVLFVEYNADLKIFCRWNHFLW